MTRTSWVCRSTGLSGIVLLVMGCGAEPLPAPQGTDEGPSAIAHVKGSVVNGKLTLSTTPTEEPGVAPQGFGEFGGGTVSFDTPSDGIGTGSCTASQYCGQVEATNLTGRLMDNMFVEITQYTYMPPGLSVTWAGPPFSISNAYANVFLNSSNIEAASYGDFAIGQTKNVEWKWDLSGIPSADFWFDAAVYASFRRTNQSTFTSKGQPNVDACAGGAPTFHDGADDAETNFELPFPFTLRDITYDRGVVGSNGYLLLYRTGDTVPTAGPNSGRDNKSMMTTGVAPGLYLFWDDLAFDTGSGVCASVTGTKPNRTYTLTWRNAKINLNQSTKTTWSTQRITYSVLIRETTDQIQFSYNLPTGSVSNFTRGQSADVGLRFVTNGVAGGLPSYSSTSGGALPSFIPLSSADYNSRFIYTQRDANP